MDTVATRTARSLSQRLGKTLPWLGAAAVVILTGLLVATIFLTERSPQAIAFLSGILIAASLAVAIRHSNVALKLAQARALVDDMRRNLELEVAQRQRLEKALSAAQPADRYLGELLPAMIVYVDASGHIVFHNRAYQQWLGIPAARLLDRTVADVFGAEVYKDIKDHIDDAFAGHLVRYERAQRMPDGQVCRLAVQYLPHFGDRGEVVGIFAILVDITGRADIQAAAHGLSGAPGSAAEVEFAASLARELTRWPDVASRLVAALDNDEFLLFAQPVRPLSPDAPKVPFHEILLRLKEEEENLMPPGAFLPLAEMHGLMPDLDEWVLRHLLDWVALDAARGAGVFSVNISGASMRDAMFGDAVSATLREHAKGSPTLCMEFDEGDALLNLSATRDFIARLRPAGCRFALSGFAGDPASFKLLKTVPLDYIKLDGGLVVNLLRDPVNAAKVKAIAGAAKSTGVLTIAQCVEDEATLVALRGMGVDFAQGFIIGHPAPIALCFAASPGAINAAPPA